MKKLSLLFLGMFSTFFLFSQTPGTLDLSFGNNGAALIDFGTTGDYCQDAALQADQKIVLAGYNYNASPDMSFARLNPDGSLDPAFGSGGLRQFVYNNSEEYIFDIAIQPDGKIIGAGYITQNGGSDMMLVRLDEDGNLDNTFSSDGLLTIDFGPAYNCFGMALTLQDDGKIVAVGHVSDLNYDLHCAICRINENGTLDTGFGSNGLVIMSFISAWNYINKVSMQGDKIVVGGMSYKDSDFFATLARFNSYGDLDVGFGDNGVASDTLHIDPMIISPLGAMCIDSEERVYFGSYFGGSIYSTFEVKRFTADGVLDDTYGDMGNAIALMGQDSYIYTLCPQYDGKILAGGASIGDNTDFAIVRFTEDGNPDNTFGEDGNGIVIQNISTSVQYPDDRIKALLIQEDGLIVAAGKAQTIPGTADFAVARFYSGLNVGMVEAGSDKFFSLYPNPASDMINIRSDKKIDQLRIIDMNGKTCYESTPGREQINISLTGFDNSVYVIEIIEGTKLSRKKLIINNYNSH